MSSSKSHGQALILGSAAIDALALGLYLASAGLFLAEVIGMAPSTVGVVLGVGGAASTIGAVPIARLTERFDGRRVLALLFIARGCAFLAFAAAQGPVSAAIVVTAAGFLNRGVGPILQSIALDGADRANQVVILARLKSLRNVGLSLGGVPVGFVLTADSPLGFRLMLMTAGIIAIAAAALAWMLPPPVDAGSPVAGERPKRARVEKAFVRLTATFGLLTMSGMVLGLGLPLLIVESGEIPRWTVGGIQVGNTALVVVLQVAFSRGSERVTRARKMMVAAGVVAAAGSFVLLGLTQTAGALSVALVAVCIVTFSIAELLASAGGSGMMLSFVPPAERANYLAVYNLGFAGATVAGPPLVGLAVTQQPWSWAVWALLFLAVGASAVRLPAGRFADVDASFPTDR
jgi:MFS family permease